MSTMGLLYPLLIILGVQLRYGTSSPVDYYATRYDHLDVETILNNRRMVNYYAACLANTGPCPPQGLEFKRILPEALVTNCSRCTEKQKVVTYRTVKRLKKEYPKIWTQLEALWDPQHIHVAEFEAAYLSQYGSANEQEILNRPKGSKPEKPQEPPKKAVLKPPKPSPELGNRFGELEPSETNDIIPRLPVESTTHFAPPKTQKPTPIPIPTSSTRPLTTNRPFNPSRVPTLGTFGPVGTNLQATVSFVAALKTMVLQLVQHKMELIQRLLTGTYFY